MSEQMYGLLGLILGAATAGFTAWWRAHREDVKESRGETKSERETLKEQHAAAMKELKDLHGVAIQALKDQHSQWMADRQLFYDRTLDQDRQHFAALMAAKEDQVQELKRQNDLKDAKIEVMDDTLAENNKALATVAQILTRQAEKGTPTIVRRVPAGEEV